MTTPKFHVKRYDRQPPYRVQVLNSSGTPEDISGAVINFSMENKATGITVINSNSTGCSLTYPTSGIFDYNWQASDTVQAGVIKIEFEINSLSGGKFTIPAKDEDEAIVMIGKDLNNG